VEKVPGQYERKKLQIKKLLLMMREEDKAWLYFRMMDQPVAAEDENQFF